MSRLCPYLVLVLLACLSASWPRFSIASEAVPKQVHLIVEDGRLVASNIRFSRFDVLKLNARERIVDKAVGEGVIVVITSQRYIGYGVTSGWRSMRTEAGEQLEEITVEDFAALIITNRRLLNFNGQTGVWGERKRGVGE